MTVHDAILEVLAGSDTHMTAAEIATALSAPQAAIKVALHELNDAGAVLLRNGLYRLSAAQTARLRREAAE